MSEEWELAEAPLTALDLGNMSTQLLREKLAQSLTMTARHLMYLAAIWRELERRGEDLSDLRIGLASFLPAIAAGRLDAEAVLRFAGQPTILRAIALLPVGEQQALARGQSVAVLTVQPDGSFASTPLPVSALTAGQARLVFGPGKLREPEEQRAVLEATRVSSARRARPGGRVRYDAQADQMRVGRAKATVGEVVAALTRDSPPTDEGELEKSVVIKLTDAEHRTIKAQAAEAGIDLQAFARAVLIKFSKL